MILFLHTLLKVSSDADAYLLYLTGQAVTSGAGCLVDCKAFVLVSELALRFGRF